MSLSNPTAKNPATRFLQWRGGAEAFKDEKTKKTRHEGGRVTYYDKEANDGKGAEIEVALPFSFIVLDQLHTITGYSEPQRSGFWSNEVRDLKNETLTVKTKAGTVARGAYDAIKDQIKSKGAKYAQSVYIAFKDESGELQIGNLKIAGAALTSWIEFQKKYDVSQCAIFITDEPKLAKKGTNYYFTPEFDGQNMSEATKKAAVKLDEEVQRYLNTYFSRTPVADDEIVDDEDLEDEELDAVVDQKVAEAEAEEETVDDEPEPADEPADDGKINLKDVPF